MYCVKCIYHQDETGRIFQPGTIILLTVVTVTCAIEFIPVYGSKMDRTITAMNSMEICDEYYQNTRKFSI
ncbi:hypothetical protein DFJ58DRAFT_780041 [Suillus subalutaceus]|uniref:uncharacterized protein n=1 Tax=Suillus subalutaceus TaxID=48586 RepID=UPI001B86811F|nr:uncharacterized protein DFJ58DRAFT_780041 [Suillus subalutaceus]KAG1859515.1 hypothetical protein DFJ58DRAFT_780041 [Suillus subalutaceus]